MQFLQKCLKPPFRMRDAHGFKDGKDVVFDRKRAENGGFLSQITKSKLRSFMNRDVSDLFFFKIDLPFIGFDEADRHIKRGGFPSAFRAKNPYPFSGVGFWGPNG